jgi:hypothetical protein
MPETQNMLRLRDSRDGRPADDRVSSAGLLRGKIVFQPSLALPPDVLTLATGQRVCMGMSGTASKLSSSVSMPVKIALPEVGHLTMSAAKVAS